MSSAGAQARVLAPVAPCHWPCRPRAWANSLSIWSWARSSWALRRSPNGYHWVLSIIWFSLVLGPLGGRRLGDNAVRVRAASALAEYPHPTVNIVHLSRTLFTSSSGDRRGCPRIRTATRSPPLASRARSGRARRELRHVLRRPAPARQGPAEHGLAQASHRNRCRHAWCRERALPRRREMSAWLQADF